MNKLLKDLNSWCKPEEESIREIKDTSKEIMQYEEEKKEIMKKKGNNEENEQSRRQQRLR